MKTVYTKKKIVALCNT